MADRDRYDVVIVGAGIAGLVTTLELLEQADGPSSLLLLDRCHPEEAARAVIRTMADRVGGTGGVILVDRHGRLGLARNTRTMTWAAAGKSLAELLAGA